MPALTTLSSSMAPAGLRDAQGLGVAKGCSGLSCRSWGITSPSLAEAAASPCCRDVVNRSSQPVAAGTG